MNTIQANSHTGDLTRDERAAGLAALTAVPPPPYYVTQEDPTDPSTRKVWTLQRVTTPEGVEPGLVWPVYASTDGKAISGPSRDKTLPPPTVPTEATDMDLDL